MVSALWSASADGNLDSVHELLKTASPADIEIKDQNGSTCLVEAVRNGHVEVVRALLDRGADPNVHSAHGPLHQLTPDSLIHELLTNAQHKIASVNGHAPAYPHDVNGDPSKQYYPGPPQYGYYPGMPPLPGMPDGASYYPPIPPTDQNAFGNLPPPEVARMIPCRYYPACRYGSSCMFAHPQAPYYSGPPPPPHAPYPPHYDPMNQPPYAPNYYPVPPPSFPPHSVPPHMNPVSPTSPHVPTPPHPPMGHARSGSDVLSPAPFSPSGAPPPGPYGPMSPASPSYHPPHPLQMPPLPPPGPQTAGPGPQSPQTMYPNGPTTAPPYPIRQDHVSPYPPPPGGAPHSAYPDPSSKSPLQHQPEGFAHSHGFRSGPNHRRGGHLRRGSFGGRKPPCFFYPSGRCRNGDDCRFPHVIQENPMNRPPPSAAQGPRPRDPAPNGMNTIEEKFSEMTVQPQENNVPRQNGTAASSRSQSTDTGNRRGPKPSARVDKRQSSKQRVPSADEFPVLGGTTTPPSRSSVNGSTPIVNGHNGPTVAQVVQAPTSYRSKDSTASTREPSTRATTPPNEPAETKHTEPNGVHAEPNGLASPVHALPSKLPLSFAAAATGGADIVKEVSVAV